MQSAQPLRTKPKPTNPRMKQRLILAAALSAFAIVSAPTSFADAPSKPTKVEVKEKGDKETKQVAKPYPLDTCIVSDEKLEETEKPHVLVYKGQEIKLCCKKCAKRFEKDSAKYMKKLEEKKAE